MKLTSPMEAILVFLSAKRASWLFGEMIKPSSLALLNLTYDAVAPESRVMFKILLLNETLRTWLGIGAIWLRVGEGSKWEYLSNKLTDDKRACGPAVSHSSSAPVWS